MLGGAAIIRSAAALPPAAAVIAAFGEKLESQRARDRRGLHQAHGDLVAQAVGLAAAVADQGVLVLVVAEVVVADGARRNEPVGAGIVELDEQARAGGAGDVALEARADAVGEEMRE